jgi:UDP-N-acetylglucosamine 2-epimerase (non-hydrolysing)
VRALLGNLPNVILTGPLDYPDFVNLMHNCNLILTDSGGLQEEGPALGKPVLVMREYTERPEGIQAGTSKLVGTQAKNIVASVAGLLNDSAAYQAMARAVNPYGDGKATERILNILAEVDMADNTFSPAAGTAES